MAFALSVYDLTNDDDDEVRSLAATTACGILSTAAPGTDKVDLLPLPAGASVAAFLIRRFSTSQDLAKAAIIRVTGGAVCAENAVAVADMLAESSKQDSALFVQEKQNLFIDEAREARLWSHVLVKMPKQALSKDLVRSLETWTIDGLDTISASLERSADGPLGWKRRPEVFVLGLRVIYASEALLVLGRKKFISTPGSEIRALLVKLLSRGKLEDVHPLLIDQLERVLHRSIVRGVARVGRVVSTLSNDLEN